MAERRGKSPDLAGGGQGSGGGLVCATGDRNFSSARSQRSYLDQEGLICYYIFSLVNSVILSGPFSQLPCHYL